MKLNPSGLRKPIALVMAIAVILALAICSFAFFSDRANSDYSLSTATFTKDGYSLSRTVNLVPYLAGEDISVTVIEDNEKDEPVQSDITMSVDWTSPDTGSSPFGNSNSDDNAVIKVDGASVNYTYNKDTGKITFTLPSHKMEASTLDNQRIVTFHIPESLKATGTLSFSFDKVKLAQSTKLDATGFYVEFNNEELNQKEALDFDADVVWDFSETLGTKKIIGYLTGSNGNFGLTVTGSGIMHDWSSGTVSSQSHYKGSISTLSLSEGITTIGDYAFSGFSEITNLELPQSTTSIGKYAFDGISITSLTIPSKVVELGAMSFGNCDELTKITFSQSASGSIEFPAAGSGTGAFYVGSPYSKTEPLRTQIITSNQTVLDYDWTSDHRGYVITVKEASHGELTVAPTVAVNGKTVTLKPEADTGYTYNGAEVAYKDASGNTKTITLDKNTLTFEMPASDVTITSKWPANTYIVKYNANTGSGTMNDSSMTYDKEQALSKNAFTKAGYTFAGWAESASGKVVYTDGATVKNLTATNGGTVNLYAKWEVIVYNITYIPNGGTLPADADTDYTVEDPATLPTPTRTGYDFEGWYEDKELTDGPYTKTPTDEPGDKIYYAKWDPIVYSISYDLKDGKLATANPATYTVETETFKLNNPTKTGYTFTGWTGSNGTTAQTSVSVTKGSTGNKTFTANWTANTNTAYTVQHWLQNLNGGAEQNSSNFTLQTADTESKTGTTASEVTPAVKTYTGFTSPSTQTVKIAADGSTVVNYYYTRNSYKLSLNKGTGISDVTGAGTYKYGADVTINATVSTGYKWSKWTGSHNTATQKYTFTMPAQDITDTANATAITYKIKYNANGGSGTMADSTMSYDTAANLTANTFTKTGYTYAGWATTANGSVVYADKASVKNLANTQDAVINLYAVWEPADGTSYKVQHWLQNLTGGTEQNSSNFTLQTADTESKTGTTASEVTPAVKTYTGFTSPSTQTVKIAADGSTVVNYYYTRNSYKLSLNKGTGISDVTGAGTYKYGADVTINATASTGYKWSKWTGTHNTATQKYTFTMPANDVTDTANATAITYNVKYNANGGSGTMSDSSLTYDKAANLTANAFSKTGYSFAGWATSADGSVVYADKESVKNLSSTDGATVNLYAKWEPISYTVKYNANGGSGTMSDSTMTYDKAAQLTANTFVKSGYKFIGWATSASGDVVYTDSQSVKNLSSTDGSTVNLYAKWEATEKPILATWNVLGVIGYTDFNGIERDEYNQPVDEGQTDFHQYKRTVSEIEIQTSYSLPADFDTTAEHGPWDVSDKQNQSVMAYVVENGTMQTWNGSEYVDTPTYKVYICNNEAVTGKAQKVIANAHSSYLFNNFNYLKTVTGGANLDMSNATTVDRMFWDCYYLETLDTSSWDMGEVVTAREMFCYAGDGLSLDVSNWDVSNLEVAEGMFRSCGVSTLDVSDWNTGSLVNAKSMFSNSNIIELDVSKWNTSNITTLQSTFSGLVELPTLDVARKTVNAGTEDEYIAWDTSKVTNTSGTFSAMWKVQELDVSDWKMDLVTDAGSMFQGCRLIETIDVSNWVTSALTDTCNMFSTCYALKSVDVSNWDTSKVEDMRWMFSHCYALTELDLSSFTFESIPATTGYTHYLENFAAYCKTLTKITLGEGWENVGLPTAGSSKGLFYVGDPYTSTAPLGTQVNSAGEKMLAYNWTTDNRGFTITVNEATGGTLTADQAVSINGKTISWTATPDSGYAYDGVAISYTTEAGSSTEHHTLSDTYTFTMPASNITITPKWTVSGPVSPVVTITAPAETTSTDPAVTYNGTYEITGTAEDADGDLKSVKVNGSEVDVADDGTWSAEMPTEPTESYTISAVATDEAGNTGDATAYLDCKYKPFVIDEDNRELVGYTGSDNEKLVIPERFLSGNDAADYGLEPDTWYQPVGIASYAFEHCDNLVSVEMPDSILSLGTYAFYHCSNLKSITLSENLEAMGSSVFLMCEALTSIDLPDSLTEIPDYAFDSCTSLKSITWPANLKSIGEEAFSNCYYLVKDTFTIPEGVTHIANSAFISNPLLTSVKLPETLTYLGGDAFSGTMITSLYIPASVTTIEYGPIPVQNAFEGFEVAADNPNYCEVDGVLYTKDMTTLVQYVAKKTDTSYTIPDTVTTIENSAFQYARNLTELIIPDSVTSIEYRAFHEADKLTSLSIPAAVTNLEPGFAISASLVERIDVDSANATYCSVDGVVYTKDMKTLVQYPSGKSETTFTIPDSVTTIGDYAFQGSEETYSVVIPTSVTKIGKYAFRSTYVSNSDLGVTMEYLYYCGTEEQWNAISFGTQWKYLSKFEIVYNYTSATSLDLLPDPELPEGVTSGEGQIIKALPDVDPLNKEAAANAPENTVFYGWLVDSGMAKQIVLPDELEDVLISVYREESQWEMTITPLYQENKDKIAEETAATEATEPTEQTEATESSESEATGSAETSEEVPSGETVDQESGSSEISEASKITEPAASEEIAE